MAPPIGGYLGSLQSPPREGTPPSSPDSARPIRRQMGQALASRVACWMARSRRSVRQGDLGRPPSPTIDPLSTNATDTSVLDITPIFAAMGGNLLNTQKG